MNHSKLYNYLLLCWAKNPNFTIDQLRTAVTKNYITAEEFAEISGQPYEV